MNRDVGDIIDRWSIAKLKAERIGTDDNKKELVAFEEAVTGICSRFPQYDMEQFKQMMLDINSSIWFLESALKNGKELLPLPFYLDAEENKEILSQIGKNTILIRNINHFRVKLKNIINKLTGEGFQDEKSHHMSE